jgi:hypothetical protein
MSDPHYGLGKMRRASVGQLIAVDACDYGVTHAQPVDCLAHVSRLFRVEQARFAFRDCAESAMARADIAQNHEGRRPFAPAFEYIGTARFLTYGVKAEVADHFMHALERFVSADSDLQPFRSRPCQFGFGHSVFSTYKFFPIVTDKLATDKFEA